MKEKYLFTKILSKKAFLAILAPPGLPPVSKTNFFLQIYCGGHQGILTGTFLSIFASIRKKYFWFFKKKCKKLANCPHFSAPPGGPFKLNSNFFHFYALSIMSRYNFHHKILTSPQNNL